MGAYSMITDSARQRPRVVVVGLASCFGCQLQITNAEQYLMDILGQIDLQYWQLVSSQDMPDEYDVAIIEGAVTTQESVATCKLIREKAAHVMVIGACAVTAGIPGMASNHLEQRAQSVYGEATPEACDELITPRPVSAVINVDSEVFCCPIDPYDFVAKLQRVLYGSNRTIEHRTLCADCKRNETECFFTQGVLCLGLVTRAGCSARCVNLGRPCNGCAGLSPDSNIDSARESCEAYGVDVAAFNKALEMFNQVRLTTAERSER